MIYNKIINFLFLCGLITITLGMKLSCRDGYYFNLENQKCEQCMENCEKCLQADKCQKCVGSTSYHLNPARTKCPMATKNLFTNEILISSFGLGCTCHQYPVTITPTPNVCSKPGKCVDCATGCIQCNNATQCIKCLQPYYLAQGLCVQCNDNQFWNSNLTLTNKCQNCPNSCYQCTSLTYCTSCTGGYQLVNNTCVPQNCSIGTYWDNTTTYCENCISNCDQCNSSTNCEFCSSQYFYNYSGSECTKCGVENCDICYELPYCFTCLNGYYTSSDQTQCYQNCSIGHCISCPSANQCLKCENGYLLNQNVNCQMNCTISNCAVCSSPNICSQCSGNYSLIQNQCKSCEVSNCAKCSINNEKICTQCTNNYQLTLNSECILICEAGQYYNTSKQQCTKCDIEYCTECTSFLNCITCENNYLFDSSSHLCCGIDNCMACTAATTCSQCADKYKLTENNKECKLSKNSQKLVITGINLIIILLMIYFIF